MLGYYVNDIAERLATRNETDGWQVNHYSNSFSFRFWPAQKMISSAIGNRGNIALYHVHTRSPKP
jgi:hypothetical protein